MLQTKHYQQLHVAALGNATITSGTPVTTKAWKAAEDTNEFEEVAVAIECGTISGSPAAEKLTVTLQHSDDAADDAGYAVPTPSAAEKEVVFGPTANGGNGTVFDGKVVMFHFAPGKYKAGVRLKIALSTTAGTETMTYRAYAIGLEPRDVPCAQVDAAAIVTPS